MWYNLSVGNMSIRRTIIMQSNNNHTHSDDEQSSSINNTTNDCNLLLNDKTKNHHPDTSIFDESLLLATVGWLRCNKLQFPLSRFLPSLIERHIAAVYATQLVSGFSLFTQ